MILRHLIIPAIVAAMLCACGSVANQEQAASPAPRQEVTRNAMRAGTWRFVYCGGDGDSQFLLKELLNEIAAAQPYGKRIDVVSCEDISRDSLGAGPIAIFGSKLPAGHPDILQEVTGENRAIFNGNTSITGRDVLLLPYYENPWSEGRTVAGLYYSANIPALVELLRSEHANGWDRFFRSQWAYEIHHADGDRIYGSYKDSTWQFDADAEIALDRPNQPVMLDEWYTIYAYDGLSDAMDSAEVRKALNFVAESVKDQFTPDCTGELEVRLYPTPERLGLRTGRMDPAQFDRQNAILHLYPQAFTRGRLAFAPNIWTAFAHTCAAVELETLPEHLLAAYLQLHASKNQLQEKVYKNLVSSAINYSTTTVGQLSPVREPTALSERHLALWARARVQGSESKAGEEWVAALKSGREADHTGELPGMLQGKQSPVAPRRTPMPRNKLAGMTFAHEGYRVHNGYGGDKVHTSMDSLAKISVNAVAIVPYTFQRNARQVKPFFLPTDAGSENDAATVHAISAARRRGWYTLLKPQIWVGGGSWPGDIDFDTDAEYDEWFKAYQYWIMHYALLAEEEGVDGLCLGTELVKTTLKHPDRWREIIADVRKVYGGQLTYAANWGEEFENLSFWSELDAIGLNSYYPLSDKASPGDQELLDGATRWLTMAAERSRQFDKPLWLTEIGYRSVEGAWVNPHAEAGDRALSAVDQRRCYEAFTTAAAAIPELEGVFIWKWPSYIGYDGGRRSPNRGFTPGGKPAAGILGDFYESW